MNQTDETRSTEQETPPARFETDDYLLIAGALAVYLGVSFFDWRVGLIVLGLALIYYAWPAPEERKAEDPKAKPPSPPVRRRA